MNIFETLAENSKNYPSTNKQTDEKKSDKSYDLNFDNNYQLDDNKSYDTHFDDEGHLNIFENLSDQNVQKEAEKFGWLDTIKDVGQQVISKGVAGVSGAYGNLLDTFGLQLKEGEQLPGQKQINNIQFDLLEKMNRGERLSFGELMLLSDDDTLPSGTRLPTSKEIKKGIEYATGIGEGKTPLGRIAGNTSEFLGEGAAFGGAGKALKVMAGSGAAGQTVREAGGPEGLASAVEIAPQLLHGGIQGRVNPRNAKDARFVESARNLGFNEREIAPLIQSDRKISKLKNISRKGTKTQQLFEDISNKSGQIYRQISEMPGAKEKISKNAANRLTNAFQDEIQKLLNTLQPSPDKQSAINFMGGAIENLIQSRPTPQTLINFWQDINSAVNWTAIKGGKKQLAQLKQHVSHALESASPEINKAFSDINELYSRYKNIANKLRPDIVDSFLNKGEMIGAVFAAGSLVSGNPQAMLGVGSEIAIRILAREMLTNPYFQNIANKLVTSFNAGSVKGIEGLVNQTKEYLERKHPQADWSFLTEN